MEHRFVSYLFFVLFIILTSCKSTDTTAPVITLRGESEITYYKGDLYEELGVHAIDAEGNTLSYEIEGEVDTQKIGEYELTYFVTGSENNQYRINRVVLVLPNLFTTIWKTGNDGVSKNNQIKLEVNPKFEYDYIVDWGDDNVDINVTADIIHNYVQAGTYTVTIRGVYPQIYFSTYFSDFSDGQKLLSVERWGENVWLSMEQAFYGAKFFMLNATDEPDLSSVTTMENMFYSARNFNQDISKWDVSSVINMRTMFYDAQSFNQDLSGWDVSSVTNMSYMFFRAKSFNQDLSKWDVSSVMDMRYMFFRANSYDQNLSNWNISSVLNMKSMFKDSKLSLLNYEALLLSLGNQKHKIT